MIFLAYAVVAALVVLFSIKCATYVDLMDKKTNLSGAFIGGVILAAVTSLPELFTSITAVVVVNNPELIIGNVLGSNLFNLAALCTLILFTTRYFSKASIAKSHTTTLTSTLILYVVLVVAVIFGKSFSIFTVDITSVIILVVYVISLRLMAGDDSAGSDDDTDNSDLTAKQVVIRFILMALGLVGSSILITYVTDIIADTYQLNASLAGALFLGVATSLPELTSSITLIKKRNYNATMGNIVGSNLFNLTIMVVGDILVLNGTVYIPSRQTNAMIVFGIIASVLMGIVLLLKRKPNQPAKAPVLYGVLAFLVVACYLGFLVYSI